MRSERFLARGTLAAVIEYDCDRFCDDALCTAIDGTAEAFLSRAREHAHGRVMSFEKLSLHERRRKNCETISLKISGEDRGDYIILKLCARSSDMDRIFCKEIYWDKKRHIFVKRWRENRRA